MKTLEETINHLIGACELAIDRLWVSDYDGDEVEFIDEIQHAIDKGKEALEK